MTAPLTTPPAGRDAEADGELLDRLRAGDGRAYEALVRRHAGRMLAVAQRFLGCKEDAADAVQDALLSAFKALPSFAGQAKVSTWLHRILVNVCLMKLRSRARRPTVALDDLLPAFDDTGHHAAPVAEWAEDVSARADRAETRARVRACIDRLPDDYRTVLLLRDIEELDTDETARLLGVTRGAVKTRLHRARQALRTLLEPVFQV